jgi:succinylarginine dihydrolase
MPRGQLPRAFPARQSREASQAVVRLGQGQPERILFAAQHPRAIDAGAFHNDVVMVGDRDRLLLHEHCLLDQEEVLQSLQQRFPDLWVYQVCQRDLSLKQAVDSYLFNSQLLHTPQGHILLAPLESSSGAAARVAQRLVDDGFVQQVIFQEVGQSMAGGGGPACLRLRLPLTPNEVDSMAPGVFLHEAKLQQLEAWIEQHYRTELHPADLADPQLLRESQQALDVLTQILQLGSLYPFQREMS